MQWNVFKVLGFIVVFWDQFPVFTDLKYLATLTNKALLVHGSTLALSWRVLLLGY